MISNIVYPVSLLVGLAIVGYIFWDLALNPFGPNTPYRLRSGVRYKEQIQIYWLTFDQGQDYALMRSYVAMHGYEVINLADFKRIESEHLAEIGASSRIICEDQGKLWAMDVEPDPKAPFKRSVRIFPVCERGDIEFSKIGLKMASTVSEGAAEKATA
ncbi:MAG: hypothetical protein HZA81_01625 [Candidatus Taylorbacteria bacterium]|nr:hypothetical protein [Candidatus Taylorbacteria bacterium]